MNKAFKKLSCGILVLFLAFNFFGCTVKYGFFEPNSHFAFPNSNVKPLGQVSGESSRTRIFIVKSVDKEMIDEAISNALKAKGGDLLINYKNTTSVTMIPIPLFTIYTTTLHIEGTACKMTIGRQELK